MYVFVCKSIDIAAIMVDIISENSRRCSLKIVAANQQEKERKSTSLIKKKKTKIKRVREERENL